MDIASILVNNIHFVYDNVVYRQIYGLSMGSPASVSLAELYMNFVETRIMNSFPFADSILVYRRFIDDCLVIIEDVMTYQAGIVLQSFLDFCNCFDPTGRLQFTIEYECDDKLPFLDILLLHEAEGLGMSVYRKSTHSNRYIPFNSCVPKSLLCQIVSNMRRRAYSYCSSDNLLHNELKFLLSTFVNNGYSSSLVSNILFRPVSTAALPKQNQTICVIPYIPRLSNCVKAYLCKEGFTVYYSYLDKLGSTLFVRYFGPNHDRGSIFDKQNVVYQIKCNDCPKAYIGKTCRSLSLRFKEHLADTASGKGLCGLAHHILASDHSFDRDGVSILSTATNNSILSTQEAVHIRSMLGHTLNKDSDMEYSKHVSSKWDSVLSML